MATIGNLVVRLTASTTNFERAMGNAAKTLRRTEREFNRVGRSLQRTGKGLMVGLTLPLLAVGTAAVSAAMKWEDAFAGVRKTVRATEQQYADLDAQIRAMSKTIPVSAIELAGLVETAGQLGIQRENVLAFSRTVADLGVVTNVAGQQGATSLARFANIMQSNIADTDRMGSTLAALDMSLATTANEILAMALRLGGAGRTIGMTEAQVFGLAGALSSVGIEAQAGGSAMSKAMVEITSQVASAGKNLGLFAKVSGMTAEQFQQSWQTDAAGTLVTFVEGLRHVQDAGGNVFAVLDALGMSEVRMRDAMLRAAGAGDLFRRSLETADVAWAENIALAEKAAERYNTLSNQLRIARNRIYDVAITLGQALAPYVNSALNVLQPFIDALQRMAQGFANLHPIIRNAVMALTLFLALIGPAIYLTGAYYNLMKRFIKLKAMWTGFVGRVAFAVAAVTGGAATVVEAMAFVAGGMIQLKSIGILGLIAATLYLVAHWKGFASFAKRVWSGVSAVVLYAASLIVRGTGIIISAIGFLIPAFRNAGKAVIGYANTVKAAAGAAWGGTTGAAGAEGIAAVADSAAKAAQTGQEAAEAQEGLADGISKAAKAANKNLQSFDQVHTIQENMAGSAVEMPDITIPDVPDFAIGDMGVGGVTSIADDIAESWSNATEAITGGWAKLKAKALETFPWITTVAEAFGSIADWVRERWDTIGPIVEGIASLLMALMVPALIRSGVEAVIAGGKMVGAWIMSGLEAVKWVGVQVAQLVALIAKWAWAGIKAVVHAGKIVLAWAMQGWEAVASVGKQVVQFGILIAKWVWAGIRATIEGAKIVGAWIAQKVEAIASVAVQVAQFAILVGQWLWAGAQSLFAGAQMAAAWITAMGPIPLVIAAVVGLVALVIANWETVKAKTLEIWTGITGWLTEKWTALKDLVSSIWPNMGETIGNWWGKIKDSTTAIWTTIAGALSGIWSGISNTATGIWRGMSNSVISIINTMIGALNFGIRGMNKINFSIPSWVPLIGGKSWGFDLPLVSKIPLLAKGAIVDRATLAMVGEGQRSEAVIPLPRGVRDLSDVVADEDTISRAVFGAMRDAAQFGGVGGQQSGRPIEVVLEVDGHELGRVALPAIQDEADRIGHKLTLRRA